MKSTKPYRISKVESCSETLTSRAGLALFHQYLNQTGTISLIAGYFPYLKKNSKGVGLQDLFRQVFCYFVDGSRLKLTQFDHLKQDTGYAGILETTPDNLASSHTVKRFFKAFRIMCQGPFREVLQTLFLWRLKQKRPKYLEITLDTMVMNNEHAQKRQGSEATYKRVQGFQPIQLLWDGFIVDAIFRRGKRHSMYGNHAFRMIEDCVAFVRTHYDAELPIVFRLDSGFLSEELIDLMNELRVGFVLAGKMYSAVIEKVKEISRKDWKTFNKGNNLWKYASFRYQCDKWAEGYPALYTALVAEEGQHVFHFGRPDNIILTNLEAGKPAFDSMDEDSQKHWAKPETILQSHHQRGADELPHRAFKEFGSEQLPFQALRHNRPYYYLMLIAFFLFQAFQEDALSPVTKVRSYANTVRRNVFDIAAKIVRKGHQLILKVQQSHFRLLNFDELFNLARSALPVSPITSGSGFFD